MRVRRAVVAGLAASCLAVAAAVAVAVRAEPGWEERCTTAGNVVACDPGDRPAAPAVAGDLLEGGRYERGERRGRVVVINFWGSWCAPCRAEIDDLERTYQATKSDGVDFLGINVRDDRDRALAFHNGRVSYPSLFDPASRLALDFDIPPNAIPATIVLDRAGRIARVVRAAVTREELEPLVADVAAERGAA
ncbi:MAG TPA: TlpA disulfide reductase family protein [Pilimelia sp.]|nr:TlpA disulfide reductase family protein [Pilimelia sp.]